VLLQIKSKNEMLGYKFAKLFYVVSLQRSSRCRGFTENVWFRDLLEISRTIRCEINWTELTTNLYRPS